VEDDARRPGEEEPRRGHGGIGSDDTVLVIK
jgi:hypothetical protein